MRRRYQPRPNFAKLWRNSKKRERWQSDFRGKIFLEDGRGYWIGATLRATLDGEEFLRFIYDWTYRLSTIRKLPSASISGPLTGLRGREGSTFEPTTLERRMPFVLEEGTCPHRKTQLWFIRYASFGFLLLC
jgi:hypothetical protein